MSKIQATAKCPVCDWELLEFFESDVDVLELVSSANKTIDSMLLDHTKSHEAFSQILSLAAKEVPMIEDSHKGFRGSFSLKYQETK